VGGLNDEYSYEILDSISEEKTDLNLFHESAMKRNILLNHNVFKRCTNILPFASLCGGAVFLDEVNMFIVFGGLGLGSRKAGILNIDKGSVILVSEMVVEDVCPSGSLFKISDKDHTFILLIGRRSVQIYSILNDEW